MKLLQKILPLAFIFVVAFSLRLVNLGYSDYQGDEIKALYILDPGQTPTSFFLEQRKGPGQFLVTLIASVFSPDYSNEFVIRLPFALAGVFSVYIFYKFIERLFGTRLAFYASFFFATNGFLVALSRIAQYQSFVILFSLMSVYFVILYKDTKLIKNLYFSGISLSLSLLFHYDGVFVLPFIFILLWPDLKELFGKQLKHVIYIIIMNLVLIGSFYIPFVLNINEKTLAYWSGRISGDVSTKISSSRYLFSVYQPIYIVHIYTLGTLVAFFVIFLSLINKLLKNPKYEYIKKYLAKNDLVISVESLTPFLGVFTWFLIPFLFMEVFTYIPGTHIYTYLIPIFVFLGLSVVFAERILMLFKNYFIPEVIFLAGLMIVFSFVYLQSYAIFVDHYQEYPWENESFFFWEFSKPTPIFHLSMFGFPYNRNWEGIREFVLNSKSPAYYSTNERDSISRFYIPYSKDTDMAGAYVYIANPQSFTDKVLNEKAAYWTSRYTPDYVFSKNNVDLVKVYLMEQGSLIELKEKGY